MRKETIKQRWERENPNPGDMRHRLFKPTRLDPRISAVERTKTATERQGGGTFTPAGEQAPLDKRYVYNPEPTITKAPPNAGFEEYRAALRKTYSSDKRFSRGERYIGTYRDDTGTVHFDPSVASDDQATARRDAKRSEEHSIYDRKRDREIVICDDPKHCPHQGGV